MASSALSKPFLTDSQRATLDEALKRKHESAEAARHDVGSPGATRGSGKGGVSSPRVGASGKASERKSKGGSAAGPDMSKKGGVKQKTLRGWGERVEDETGAAPPSLDAADPNYSSGEDDGDFTVEALPARPAPPGRLAERVQRFKAAVVSILAEYLESGDVAESAMLLGELDLPQYDYYLVKRAVSLALDRKDRDREAVCVLLSELYGQITPDQMQKGFVSLIEGLDDLLLDVPDATELLARFVCRAVVDDVLPPSFVTRLIPVEGTHIGDLKRKCEHHLSARHSAESLLRCWGGGAGSGFAATREAIAKTLAEYKGGGEGEEVDRRLQGLGLPFVHHEVVKQALMLCLEDEPQRGRMMSLLAHLGGTGQISSAQMAKGFQRVAAHLPDHCLDVPGAAATWEALLQEARKLELIPADASLEEGGGAGGHDSSAHVDHSLAAFKSRAIMTVKEYFDSADWEEVGRSLQAPDELGEPGLHHVFVKHAMRLAMDRKDRERELVSTLLAKLPDAALSADQVQLGFTRLLAEADDLVLDIPFALHLIGNFLGRAIVDEVLPPAYLSKVLSSLAVDSAGLETVTVTIKLLSARHAGQLYGACWHAGGVGVDELKTKIKEALKEYVASGDIGEATLCLRELDCPLFHHEAATRALEMSFLAPEKTPQLKALLRSLSESGAINQTQMAKGFDRVQDNMDDMVLDYPQAAQQYAALRSEALEEGWLVLQADDDCGDA